MPERAPDGTVYDLTGPADAPVVALIHGLGLNRRVWRWHAPDFSERYRVVNYDLFGHGDSPAPPEAPTLSLFAAQLRRLMDHLGVGQCAPVGFSLGGMINRRFAMDNPDRVSALAILNSPHERAPDQQRLVEERAARTAAAGPAATLDSTIERWFTPEFIERRPDAIADVRRWVLSNESTVYAQCRQVLAGGVTELIRPRPPIAQPMLVIATENDTGSTPAMSKAIAGEAPLASALILPGLKHMGLVEQPAKFTGPILRFLDGVLSPSRLPTHRDRLP